MTKQNISHTTHEVSGKQHSYSLETQKTPYTDREDYSIYDVILDEKFITVGRYFIEEDRAQVRDIQRTFDFDYDRTNQVLSQLMVINVIEKVQSPGALK